jgi:DNA-directed RNA polymerase subunit RPC12/RpoP
MSKIEIICVHCSKTFKEHHSKIRSGLSVVCPICSGPIVFDSNAVDLNIRKTLAAARRFRLNVSTSTN